jgi:hypothetical protein
MKTRKAHTLFIFTLTLLLGASFLCIRSADADTATVQGNLKGSWKSGCMDLGASIYAVTTISYDGAGKSNDKIVFYSDAACSKPTEMVKTNTSSYKIGNKVDVGGQEAYEFEVTIKSWKLTQYGSLLKSGGPVPTQYDIISIQDDKLYTSGVKRKDKGPILDPAQRPTTLDKKNYYTRQ